MVKTARGYTLVEVMLTVAIMGIVMMIGPRLLIQTVRFIQLHNAKVEIQRDARVCLDIINRFIRQAKGYTVVIDQAANQAPFSRISFTTVSGQPVQFYQSGTQLYEVTDSTVAISNNVRYIAFTYPRSDDPSIISVALTMEKSTFEGGNKALELSIEKVRVMN